MEEGCTLACVSTMLGRRQLVHGSEARNQGSAHLQGLGDRQGTRTEPGYTLKAHPSGL